MKNTIRNVFIAILCAVLLTALIFVAYKRAPVVVPAEATHKLSVVTSFYPLYFFATQIAGDKALVYNLTPAGAEPHDYEPTAQDIARIEDSQLIILNGGKLEAWGDAIKSILQGKQTAVITVGDEFADKSFIENGERISDPHVWLDPLFAKKEAAVIARNLEKIDPANAAFFATNLAALNAKLDNLDKSFRAGLSNCQKKDIITSHAAFSYLAAEYGFNQVPISGVSPDVEPSPAELVGVADFVKKNQVKYIFFETLVSPKFAQTIANETGAQTLVLNPIEGLTDEEIAADHDYFTEMNSNLINLRIALQCQ